MKVLVIGSGGREHALCWAIRRSSKHSSQKLFCAPGNAGIAEVAECVQLSATDVRGLADFAEHEGVELTIVGGEAPLAAGLADEFARRGLIVAGPSREAARLESSKAFAKDFMLRHKVPTARHRVAASVEEAKEILRPTRPRGGARSELCDGRNAGRRQSRRTRGGQGRRRRPEPRG